MKKLLNRIKKILHLSRQRPDCSRDDEFIYCYCGKCEPKEYDLPSDFNVINALKISDMSWGNWQAMFPLEQKATIKRIRRDCL